MSPKFCAGCTTEGRKVESIDRMPKSATTGTPAALTAKPDGTSGAEVDFWAAFGLMVACFVIVLVEDHAAG